MPNPYFRFKQFTIFHDQCAMKVGTDGVLLGAWANVEKSNRILDIGTGTGLIALMLAQRTPNTTTIDAIDSNELAIKQATQNIANSPWPNKVQPYQQPFQKFTESLEPTYDLIVSNPPYFVNSYKAKKQARNEARHTDSLSFQELLAGVKKCLLPTGKFCVILPFESGKNFQELAQNFSLYPTKICSIKPTPNKAPKRLLLEVSNVCLSNINKQTLVIETDKRHKYTNNYQDLTKDFYLNF